jgi:hypothetical protein
MKRRSLLQILTGLFAGVPAVKAASGTDNRVAKALMLPYRELSPGLSISPYPSLVCFHPNEVYWVSSADPAETWAVLGLQDPWRSIEEDELAMRDPGGCTRLLRAPQRDLVTMASTARLLRKQHARMDCRSPHEPRLLPDPVWRIARQWMNEACAYSARKQAVNRVLLSTGWKREIIARPADRVMNNLVQCQGVVELYFDKFYAGESGWPAGTPRVSPVGYVHNFRTTSPP